MILSNWLRPLRSRILARRKSWEQIHAPADTRADQSVERLETRLYLSGLASYSTASSDWFGVVDASFSSVTGIGGSSTSGGTSSDAAAVRQFLVRLTPEATLQAGSLAGVQNLISDSDVELVVTDGLGLPGQVIVSTTERDSVQVVQSLSNNDSVAYFEEDFSVGATTRFPNEDGTSAEFSRQYGLNNTGQTGGVADADIDAPEAWDISIGSTQIVASVIDSGVDFTHPDLYLNIWLNQGELPPQFVDPDATSTLSDVDSDGLITFRDLNDAANASFVTDLNSNGHIDASDLLEDPKWADGIDTDDNGFEDDLVGWDFFENDNKPFDEHRHGTHVAGILGAVGDNGFGVSGVNWQTSIMSLRFLDEDNRGDISSAVEAINYTTMMRTRAENPVNVRVSNNSWGASGAFSQTLFDAVAGNERADILFVAAAGNGDVLGQGVNNDDVAFFPANLELDNVISVAAINDRGELASFSNFGTTTVDIAAPGVSILSTDAGGGFISRSGTSMATPFVAGVGALVFDVFPEATAAEVRDAILSGAVTSASLDGFIEGSRSLNALGALTASTFAPVPELEPVATITTDGTPSLDITVTYIDDGSVDTTSFDIRDVEITRQGFSETLLTPTSVATTTVNVDGQDRDAAIYTFTAPGGTFDATDNGTWFVSLREREIQDNLGLYSAPRELGQFTVSIDTANVFFVNTTLDTTDADLNDGVPEDSAGRTSLRAAIMHANQAGASTTIVIPDGIYALTIPGQNENASATGDLDLTSTQGITIVGGGGFATTIDAQQLDRVFDIASGATATLKGLGIRNGNADQGGGIKNAGTLTVNESLITTNSAETAGGGVFNSGHLTLVGSSLEENETTSRFGGIGGGGLAAIGGDDATTGTTLVASSSVVNNISADTGGGIVGVDAEVKIGNTTVSNNVALRGDGGGLSLRLNSGVIRSLDINSATIVRNRADSGRGGGIAAAAGPNRIVVENSIVALNEASSSVDVRGRVSSNGRNFFGVPDSADAGWRLVPFDKADFDEVGSPRQPLDPMLEELARTDDIVQINRPMQGSPAVDNGSTELTFDALGTARITDAGGVTRGTATAVSGGRLFGTSAIEISNEGLGLAQDFFFTATENASGLLPNSTFDAGLGARDPVTADINNDGNVDLIFSSASADSVRVLLGNGNGTFLPHQDFDAGVFPHYTQVADFNNDGQLDVVVANSDSQGSILLGTREPLFAEPIRFTLGNTNGLVTGDIDGDGDNDLISLQDNGAGRQPFLIKGLGTGEFLPPELMTGVSVNTTVSNVAVSDLDSDGIADLVFADSNSIDVRRGLGGGGFAEAMTFTAGERPLDITIADFDHDGIRDVAVANFTNAGTATILLGNGDATFGDAQTFPAASPRAPRYVEAGDFDGDGNLDLVLKDDFGSPSSYAVILGNGDGTFGAASLYTSNLGASHTALGDFDGDGRDDIVANDFILFGDSSGELTSLTSDEIGQAGGPTDLVTGDFDGDDVPDLVVATIDANAVSFLKGRGDGTFASTVSFPAGNRPLAIAAADFDGNDTLDVVVANETFGQGTVSVLLGDGAGAFSAPANYDVGSFPSSVVTGHLNSDAVIDLVVTNTFSDSVSVLIGNGDGTYSSSMSFPAGNDPQRATFGDFNSDGRADVAVTNGDDDTVSVLLGNGDGTLQSRMIVPAGEGPDAIVSVDLDGDGAQDLVFTNQFGDLHGEVGVLSGNGDGTFQSRVGFQTEAGPTDLAVGDIDGDGHFDLFTTSGKFGASALAFLPGNGDGTFQNYTTFAAGESPQALTLVDINADDIPDVVTANEETNRLSILTGQPTQHLYQASADVVLRIGSFSSPPYELTEVNGLVFFFVGGTETTTREIWSFDPSSSQLVQRTTFLATTSSDVPRDPIGGSDSMTFVTDSGLADFDITTNTLTERPASVSTYSLGGAVTAANFVNFQEIETGDFDGDGIPDTVGVVSGDNITFLKGMGDGRFGPEVIFFTGLDPHLRADDLVVADLDGNGTLDIIVPGSDGFGPGLVSVLSGNGDGTFQAAQLYDAGNAPKLIRLADVSGDGSADLIVANLIDAPPFEYTFSILTGNGDGTFESPSTHDPGMSFFDIESSDFTGDGDVDILLIDRDTNVVAVVSGNGDGTFGDTMITPAGSRTEQAAIGDFDSDGIIDVAATNVTSDGIIQLLRGNGDGSFETLGQLTVPGVPNLIESTDLNRDGHVDLVVTTFSVNVLEPISVFFGKGDGSFGAAANFAAGTVLNDISFSDVDSDNLVDIVAADPGEGGIVNKLITIPALLLQEPLQPESPIRVGASIFALSESGVVRYLPGESGEVFAFSPVSTDAGILRQADYQVVSLFERSGKLISFVQLTDGSERGDLFETDPVTGVTRSLMVGSSDSLRGEQAIELVSGGDTIYLAVETLDDTIGQELYQIGLQSGLTLAADVFPGPESSSIRGLAVVDGLLYFTAFNSSVDAVTGVPVQRRQLFMYEPEAGFARPIRSAREVSASVHSVGSGVVVTGRRNASGPELLWLFDNATVSADIGAVELTTGIVSGEAFLDINSNGRRDSDETGLAGRTLFLDANRNGLREADEATLVTRADDPATLEDEAGIFSFPNLAPGNYTLRVDPVDGFTPTTPVTVATGDPTLSLLGERIGEGLGDPSIVGDEIVFLDTTSGRLVKYHASGGNAVIADLSTTLPGVPTSVASFGRGHAFDGERIVFTVLLEEEVPQPSRELVVVSDSSGLLSVVADTAVSLRGIAADGQRVNVTIDDFLDSGVGAFDSLSVSGESVGFLAATAGGLSSYYLGAETAFAEFEGAQVILDGAGEVLVRRVIDGNESAVLTANQLLLDKATLDSLVGGNTGWQITTHAGEEILPLTFFDRIVDLSASGLSVAFRAIGTNGVEGVYLASVSGGSTRIVDTDTLIPGGTGSFTTFGSLTQNSSSASVSIDNQRVVFLGQGDGGQIGLYGIFDGVISRIVDAGSNWGGKQLSDLSIGHRAISGNRIAFRATFSDGSDAIFVAELPSQLGATVTISAGQTVSGVLFGASAEAGVIRGASFTDLDVDGVFDAGEDGNVGRTVFLDANLNGQLDESEIRTVTDANGEFVFSDLPAETEYVVREVVPEGLAVTVPQTLAAATVRLPAAGTVEVVLGSVDSGALGNSADGVVSGVIFNDTNGDGERGDASAEPGIPDLTVFVDENGDGILNGGERSSTTAADGSYTIDQLRGTKQAVRVVLPGNATDQTSPLGNSFTTATLNTVDSPVEVITGDFNGDGVDDIATTINQVSEVRLFNNNGEGVFLAGGSVEVDGGPGSIAVGSFLGAGGRDGMVVGHRTTSSVKVLLPQQDNSFNIVDLITPQDVQPGGQFAGLGNAPYFVTTADFDADGNDDIAVVSQNALPAGGVASIFLSNGDGTFTREQSLILPRADADFPTAVTAGKVDAGDTVDLVISNLSTANVTILKNSGVAGSSRFSIDQHLPVLGRAPSSVQVGDLDGDGDNEIVTTNLLSNNVSVFDNNGDGTFATANVLTAGQGPAFSRLVDLDQNGSLDIAFSNSEAGNRFGILRNRGDGTFLAAETSGLALLSDGTLAFSLAVGSFDDDNGDGVIDDLDTPDVVVSNRAGESLNSGAGSLTVGLNTIVPGALTVELPTDTRSASGLDFGLRTINLPPTVSTPDDPDPIDEDSGQQTVVLTGITTGGETETLEVTVASDNTSLIAPVVTYNAGAETATVRYTPAADQSGTARITVTVRDAGIDGSFDVADPESDDGVATASFNVVVKPVNDLPPAEADTFGVLLEDGATVLNVLANDNLANPDTGEPLTILFAGQPESGSVAIVNGGTQLQYTPAAGFIGQETFSYIVSDNQFTAQGSVTVNVTSNVTPSDLLTVSSFTPNPSGFEVVFSEAFNASLLNLYATQSLGPADVVVSGSSSGVINGSLIVDATTGSVTFIKTGGRLASDTYTVTIRSGNDSFVTGDGDLLDGDSNGTGGDDFSTVFTVAPLSPETVMVSVPDFTRGFGQTVNVPADGTGIPLTLSRGTGISGLNLQVSYNSSLLEITDFVPTVAGLLTDFNTETGALAVSKPTEFISDAGPLTIGYFTATVPTTALYTSKHLISVGSLQVFDDSVDTALIPSVADSAIHIAAFPGDANASRSYNSPDTTLTLRQATDRIDGLSLYPLADPALISDVTFDSSILANDATVVQRLITSVDVPAVPDLPSGIDPLPARGDDPILSIPQNLAGRLGQTITVPVQLEVTEPSGITVSGLDVAIAYDASQFSVSNVRVGSLLTDNDLSPFSPFANTATPGQILITASSSLGTTNLAQNTTGDVFLIDFTVLPTATGGASAINLLANSSGLITGIADIDLSDLVLSPAPSNAANDSVDGLFTVTTDVTLVERSGDGQLIVRDASSAGLNNALTFTLDGATLVITESVLPVVAAFGQQITDQEVRVTLADLSTSTVSVQLMAGDDSADGSALTSSVSLRLEGGPGDDMLTGGGGADVLLGGAGDDALDGGGGVDVLAITQDGDLSITTTQTFGQGTDSFANIEQAVLEGGARNNRLDASQATIPVTLRGLAGDDTLLGGSAADVLDGGAGGDFAEIFGSNIVLTNGAAPGAGGEILIALEGLQLVASARGSNIDASGYTLGPVTIIGSSGNDTLKGGSADDLIMAGAGRDSIDGGGGADFIAGGRGRDTINGNGGNDFIFGGGGRDLIDGGADSDALFGGNRADTIRGGDGADFIFGGRGRDSIDGDGAADTLFGGGGRDNIAGGLGADRLNGIDRDDTFSQVVGRDTLFGGQRPQERPAPVSQGHEPVERQDIPLFQSPPGDTEEIDEAFGVSIMPELLEL